MYQKQPDFDTLGDPFLPSAARVGSLRVLGVVVSSNLSMGTHLDGLISNCASSIHALRMLRTHGLPPVQLQEVACMTTISSLLYASPACWGFTSAHDRDRLECLVERLRRGGYLPEGAPLICGDGHESLFQSIITNPGHVLYRHLPKVKTTGYNLHPRAHAFDDRNFISHFLFSNIYRHPSTLITLTLSLNF